MRQINWSCKATIIDDWQLQTDCGLRDGSGFQSLWFYKLKDTFKDGASKAQRLSGWSDWKRNKEERHVERREAITQLYHTHSHSSSLCCHTPWEETLTHIFNYYALHIPKNTTLCPCLCFLYFFICLVSPLSWGRVIINTNDLTNKQAPGC